METIIGDYIGTTIGIHSPIAWSPTKHQTGEAGPPQFPTPFYPNAANSLSGDTVTVRLP